MATRQREIFTTIHTEGAILPPDLLQRIAEGGDGLDGLRAEDYHRPGERLNEVINRAWNVLLGAWVNFQTAREQLPPDDIGTTVTRERWLLPLFRELDYGRLPTERAIEIDGKSYPISHRDAAGNVPIHLVSFKVDLDKRTPGVAGAATTSPHSMVQTYLNRSENQLWGFLSNGLRLRILRDNISLTRQAYVEFDLEAMMNGEVYADFVLLWLLCHQSRVEGERPEQFWLERWMQTAVEQGTRALDQLRDNVERAIERLGAGFIAHPQNIALRDKLQSGALDKQDYYRQLLRLVYRLLFLFVAEDRVLLLHPDADDAARERYIQFYSTRRLRDLAARLRGTRHADLYHGLRLVMQLLGAERNGEGRALGLPVLGSFLFSDEAVADIIRCEIANRDLLDAVRALAFTEDRAVRRLRPVDYKNLGPEELGSVYESLLELHPQVNIDARTFALTTASGHERKTTGSYYTPSSLIQALLDSALDPVLDEARKQGADAILNLKVCDPACGSGHFLIAAAHRIAKALASVKTMEDEPAPDAVRAALRDVIGRCIYGVDINPMAVELCKVGLWMEALEPGKPLSFLDHRIQCGNSLLGTTPALMLRGIPDEAFQPIEGDDKAIVSELRKRNREERKQREAGTFQHGLWDTQPAVDHAALAAEARALAALDDTTLAGVRAKEARYRARAEDPNYIKAQLLADAWCAAFVWEKVKGFSFPVSFPVTLTAPPITDLIYRRLERDPHAREMADLRAEVVRLRERYQFFHWHVAFPDVFHVPERIDTESVTGWTGGFDVVLGNPPWERIKIQEKEWFAERNPDIANAPSSSRQIMITALKREQPQIYATFLYEKRRAEGEVAFARNSNRFPLCGRGDVNTYSLFTECGRQILNSSGRLGMIVPSGIATDSTTQYFFRDLIESSTLVSIFDFENRDGIFPSVHRSYKFCLLTIVASSQTDMSLAEFGFFLHAVGELYDNDRRYSLSPSEIRLLNPNTLTCPVFRSRREAEITKAIYRRIPIFISESRNPWQVEFNRMYHMSDDAHLFRTEEQLLASGFLPSGNFFKRYEECYVPLYEGKMVDSFNHRFASVVSNPDNPLRKSLPVEHSYKEWADPDFRNRPLYWVPKQTMAVGGQSLSHTCFLVYKRVTTASSERTFKSCLVPAYGIGDKLPLILGQTIRDLLLLAGNFNSFVFDFVARQKTGYVNLAQFVLMQLPVLPPDYYTPALLAFIVPRVLELTYTAWDLQPFAQDVGWDGPPFVWDEERRFLMRCELDALYFHLYGIARDDVDYIMETFPIVKRKDEAAHGEYRTKRTILELYDEMAALGVHEDADCIAKFETWLTPPPADPRVAHPPRE